MILNDRPRQYKVFKTSKWVLSNVKQETIREYKIRKLIRSIYAYFNAEVSQAVSLLLDWSIIPQDLNLYFPYFPGNLYNFKMKKKTV